MDDLLRFSSAVRRDPQIEAWFSNFADPFRLMTRTGLSACAAAAPMSASCCTTAVPCACVEDAPFGYVNAFKAHASVGFYCGAMLADPADLLEGTGKRMRHVKLRPANNWTSTLWAT